MIYTRETLQLTHSIAASLPSLLHIMYWHIPISKFNYEDRKIFISRIPRLSVFHGHEDCYGPGPRIEVVGKVYAPKYVNPPALLLDI